MHLLLNRCKTCAVLASSRKIRFNFFQSLLECRFCQLFSSSLDVLRASEPRLALLAFEFSDDSCRGRVVFLPKVLPPIVRHVRGIAVRARDAEFWSPIPTSSAIQKPPCQVEFPCFGISPGRIYCWVLRSTTAMKVDHSQCSLSAEVVDWL
jgi:hypothetical protein